MQLLTFGERRQAEPSLKVKCVETSPPGADPLWVEKESLRGLLRRFFVASWEKHQDPTVSDAKNDISFGALIGTKDGIPYGVRKGIKEVTIGHLESLLKLDHGGSLVSMLSTMNAMAAHPPKQEPVGAGSEHPQSNGSGGAE